MDGDSVEYANLSIDALPKDLSRRYQLSDIIAGQPEVFITNGPIEPGNILTDAGNFDHYGFSDFATSSDVELRVYWQGSASASNQARVSVNELFINSIAERNDHIEDWRDFHFGTTANSEMAANGANPDGDSLNNYAEYALGTNPNLSDCPIHSVTSSTTLANTMELVSTRRNLSENTVYPEWSPDLLDPCFDTGFSEVIDPNTPPVAEGDVEPFTVTFPIDVPKKFVRFRVDE